MNFKTEGKEDEKELLKKNLEKSGGFCGTVRVPAKAAALGL